MPSATPARISLPDRYRVIRHLANGGMASVWEAHDELLDRAVAVKLLAPHLSEDERARKRFQREARAAAGLSSHPNVVTIYDVGEHDGRVFMVMELMQCGSVADRLRSGEEITHERALRWLSEGAAALDAAHDAGIVHRDIKPANMLLDARDRLAIADFGIARLALEDQLTATGQVLGTAAYISPEQAMGEPATAASDRYALAVVAFEMLTGTRPFEAEHFAAQARAHVEDAPPPASERAPELPPEADEVLERGLAKDPADRWESCDAGVQDLRRALASRREPTPPTRRIAPRTAARPAAGAPRAYASTGGGRGGSGALLAGLAALVLLGVLGFVLLTGGSGGKSERETSGSTHRTQPKRSATPTATQTAAPAQSTPTATQPAAPVPAAPVAGGDPRKLNDQGFRLLQGGQADKAVPILKQAYDACKGSSDVNPCGYALYNYADALVRSGHPDQAIPILQERLRRFDNQNDKVNALLQKAQQQAGHGGGPGKGKGKGKKKGKD